VQAIQYFSLSIKKIDQIWLIDSTGRYRYYHRMYFYEKNNIIAPGDLRYYGCKKCENKYFIFRIYEKKKKLFNYLKI